MGEIISGRRKQSILVVDDHRLNAELLRELLATRGYQASVVASPAEAETQIRRSLPILFCWMW